MQSHEVAALAHWPDDVSRSLGADRIDSFDAMVRVVMGWTDQVVHSRVDDYELFSHAPLAVMDTGDERAGIAHEEPARFDCHLESRGHHQPFHYSREGVEI